MHNDTSPHTCAAPRTLQFVLTLLVLALGQSTAFALKLPAIFGSNMVLQQESDNAVWGWSDANETITVTFADESVSTTADKTGRWKLTLPTDSANTTGRSFTVTGSNGESITLDNVLVGEVWICSGQSNMEWSVNKSANRDEEKANANYPTIRFFDVKNQVGYEPKTDLSGSWEVCSPETVGNFSAVAYYFGRKLHQDLDCPIGLISTNWGGTVAEAWTSAEALQAHLPEFSSRIAELPNMDEKMAKRLAEYEAARAEVQVAKDEMFELEDDYEIAATWADPARDDSDWPIVEAPGNWKASVFPKMDGIVWYRMTIDVPESWAGRDLELRPGSIDEIDTTWFNGQQVGASGNARANDTSNWDVPREYTVPGNLVKVGKNIIAIRIIDTSGHGGLRGTEPDMMYIAPAGAAPEERISLAGNWRIQKQFELPTKPRNPISPNIPSVLYNQMIAPLIPFGVRGAIWYQGESNASRAEQYRTLLPTMIADWRERWGQDEFTFLIVQLANYRSRKAEPADSQWAELREAQAMTAANDPATGLAVTIDIGDARDIHPKNKQDVGKRLALAAESMAYDMDVVFNGPTFTEMEIEDNVAVLHFDHADGLTSVTPEIGGFSIRGEGGEFVWANAVIDGDTVRVSAESIETPLAVRYAWADNPEAPLYNEAGLPMVPFRTDQPE
ncbi:MAG: sialate O-acetylesterase [Puniceicoccales bacterium]